MIYLVLAMRAAMVVVCIETAVRYALWWVRVGPKFRLYRGQWRRFFKVLVMGDSHGILPPLMLGIAVAQSGIALRHIDVFYYSAAVNTQPIWLAIVFASDVLMLMGTFLHLVPAWELTPGPLERSLPMALIIRFAMVSVLCTYVVLADGLAIISR